MRKLTGFYPPTIDIPADTEVIRALTEARARSPITRFLDRMAQERGTLFSQDSPGLCNVLTAVATATNPTTETALISFTLLGGSARVGTCVYFELYGSTDYTATGGSNCVFRAKIDTLNVYDTTAPVGAATNTNRPLMWQAMGVFRVAGNPATVAGGGMVRCEWSGAQVGSTGAHFDVDGDNVSTTLNSNADIPLSCTVQTSVSNAANIVRAHAGYIALWKV